jgi:hypothetical protein
MTGRLRPQSSNDGARYQSEIYAGGCCASRIGNYLRPILQAGSASRGADPKRLAGRQHVATTIADNRQGAHPEWHARSSAMIVSIEVTLGRLGWRPMRRFPRLMTQHDPRLACRCPGRRHRDREIADAGDDLQRPRIVAGPFLDSVAKVFRRPFMRPIKLEELFRARRLGLPRECSGCCKAPTSGRRFGSRRIAGGQLGSFRASRRSGFERLMMGGAYAANWRRLLQKYVGCGPVATFSTSRA